MGFGSGAREIVKVKYTGQKGRLEVFKLILWPSLFSELLYAFYGWTHGSPLGVLFVQDGGQTPLLDRERESNKNSIYLIKSCAPRRRYQVMKRKSLYRHQNTRPNAITEDVRSDKWAPLITFILLSRAEEAIE